MWGHVYFGNSFWSGQFWGPLSGVIPPPVVVTTIIGGDEAAKPKKKKNKYDLRVENYQSPANFPRPFEPIPETVETPDPVEALETAGKPIAVIVPKSMKRALAPKAPRSVMDDPAVRKRLADLQARMEREKDDEEILLMLGGFD